MKTKQIAILLCGLCFIISLTFFSSHQSSSMRMPAKAVMPKHYIYLIHGIMGSQGHFEKMKESLEQHLPEFDSAFEHKIFYFNYDTGNDELSTYDFARQFFKYLDQTIPKDETDYKISLVMHSQGGLVGAIWLYRSFVKDAQFSSDKVNHLDAFITLGTPFWGAKTAVMGSLINRVLENPSVLPYGEKEINEMSFLSDTIYNFRQGIIHNNNFSNYLKSNVRMLNIAAVAQAMNFLNIFSTGKNVYEDDSAVILPSARFDFFYQEVLADHYPNEEIIPAYTTKKIELAPFLIVDAVHLTPKSLINKLPSVVQIPSNCVEDALCDHPTFSYILKHLANVPFQINNNEIHKKLTSFFLELNIRLEAVHKNIKLSDFQIEYSPKVKELVSIDSKTELYSKGEFQSQENPHHYRFYKTGDITSNQIDDQQIVVVTIKLNGYKSKIIEIYVSKGQSSYIDVLLEKNLNL